MVSVVAQLQTHTGAYHLFIMLDPAGIKNSSVVADAVRSKQGLKIFEGTFDAAISFWLIFNIPF